MLKKEIKYNSSDKKTIRITIGKKDNFKTNSSSLYILTAEEMQQLEKKQSDDINNLKNEIEKIQNKLDNEKIEYQKLANNYNNLNNILIEYQNKITTYNDKIDDYQKQINSLNQYTLKYANKYNSLRNAVKSFRLLDLIRNKHKKILDDEYKEITILAEPIKEIGYKK
ncbi:MAG: hypothetical protein IJH39_03655 [Clostridia bacterium]|nr:hypothetical protein [Clostridia bacterium]